MTQTMALPVDRKLATDPAEGAAWWFLGTLAVLRNPEGAPPTPTVIELTVPPGGSPPRHVHEDLDDSFLMLEGEAFVRCGDQAWIAKQGSYVVLPRGVEHTFRVTSTKPAKLLLVHADDSFLRFIEAVGTPTDGAQLPPAGTPTPDIDVVTAAWEAHGGRFVGPSVEPEEVQAYLPDATAGLELGTVNHISLHVSDVLASEHWYANALDLIRVDGAVDDEGRGHLVMLNPANGWLITLLGPAEPRVEHVAFSCPDRDALLRCRGILAERGVTPGDVTDAPYGSGFVLRDPDGLEVELFAAPAA